MARGNGRMSIFLDDTDYRMFVRLLGDVVEDLEIQCWNYCVMPNHFHATLCPSLPNLSEALRRINGRYAQWWNRRHGRVGHVFQGRFKDQIVQREGYLAALCRYVAMNPVRAGLVTRPEDWEWSSYAATTGQRPSPSFLAIDLVLRQFGDGELPDLQQRFAAHVLGSSPEETCTDERIRSNESIVGDSEFKRSLRPEAGEASDVKSAPTAQETSVGAIW
jgi:REP element-mobilizing transposase RayT